MKKITEIQEREIKELLINGNSIKYISDSLGICREVVRRRARQLGIKPFSGKSIAYNLQTAPNDLKQLLIGSLLGDGTFTKIDANNSSCCFTVAHKKDQYDYLKFKFDILDKYNLVNKIISRTYTDNRFKDSNYTEYRIKSRVNPIFTYIRNEAYFEGKKTINLNIIEDIDALGLAIWYMDDGYVTKSSCIFSTCSFTMYSQQRLADFLLGRFNLHFTVGKNDNSLYLLAKDFNKFRTLISPYILPILQYKLEPYKERVLHKSGELLEHPKDRTISSQATEVCESM